MVLIEHGKGLECNTGGLRYGLSQPNPSRRILKRYRELGGEIITIGSDAHTPDYLGYGFQECRRFLLRCGFRYYTVFHGRKPEFIPL
jgi:histidinol-phosphatase (PHP family)